MKALRNLVLSTLFVAVALGLGPAQANDRCREIDAKLVGQFVGPLNTAGTIHGGGLLNGTTAFTGDALAPSAGLATTLVPATTVSYTGVLVITTHRGTLTLRDIGIFDTDLAKDGEFSSRSRVVAGTGRFAGASGILFFHGDSLPDATFTAEVNGTICLVRSDDD
jgi:hypothetical protein